MKPLNIPKESQEALLNGASMFLMPIDDEIFEKGWSKYQFLQDYRLKEFAPYQIGDEVYLQEDNRCPKCNVFYNNKMRLSEHIEQCDKNYKYKATIKDIKVVRVHDLFSLGTSALLGAWSKTEEDFKDWYNKQYGNYEDNPLQLAYQTLH